LKHKLENITTQVQRSEKVLDRLETLQRKLENIVTPVKKFGTQVFEKCHAG